LKEPRCTSNPDYILNGSDGGVYESRDGGSTRRFFDNLPLTRFYKIALDNDLPFYNVHGSVVNFLSGPQRTRRRALSGNGYPAVHVYNKRRDWGRISISAVAVPSFS